MNTLVNPNEISELAKKMSFRDEEKSVFKLAVETFTSTTDFNEQAHRDRHNDCHKDTGSCLCVIGGL